MCSNNTNKLSPQEREGLTSSRKQGSNNTNKLSPQERAKFRNEYASGSNNTNKLSPQEPNGNSSGWIVVQIIQINLVLKNKEIVA